MRFKWFSMLLCMFLLGCSYEEGPAVSLRSKNARITNKWKQTIVASGLKMPYNQSKVLELFDDGKGKETWFGVDTFTGEQYVDVLDVEWKWFGDKEHITFHRSIKDEELGRDTFRVVRLSSKELYLENKAKIWEQWVAVK